MSFNLSAEKFVIFTAVLSAIATVLLLGPDVGLAYATSSNTIYFGLGIPGAIPSGVYTQTITIENSC